MIFDLAERDPEGDPRNPGEAHPLARHDAAFFGKLGTLPVGQTAAAPCEGNKHERKDANPGDRRLVHPG